VVSASPFALPKWSIWTVLEEFWPSVSSKRRNRSPVDMLDPFHASHTTSPVQTCLTNALFTHNPASVGVRTFGREGIYMKYTWWPVVTFFIGALLTWLFTRWGLKKGKKYDEVFDRVVEESTDESTKLRTLTDGHDTSLAKLRVDHDASLAKLKSDHDSSLVLLRKEHDTVLGTHKAESTKLQGLVSTGDTHKVEADSLRAQIQKLKDDHGRFELDWKKKVEVAEAASVASTAKIRDLETSHARTIGEWDVKVKAAETKHAEVQGLLGSTKADTEKVSAEWTGRISKLEGELAAAKEHSSKVELDWKSRYTARETELTAANTSKLTELQAAHTRSLGEWEVKVKAAESKQAEVQGLLGSTKADTEKVSVEWNARIAKLEADLASSRDQASKADAEWKVRYAKVESDAAAARDGGGKIEADWKARYAAREAELTNANAAKVRDLEAAHTRSLGEWEVRVKTAEAKHTEVQGLLGSTKADTEKVSAEWNARIGKLEADLAASRDQAAKTDADWKLRYAKVESDAAAARDGGGKIEEDWKARYSAREAELQASHTRSLGEWELKVKAAESKQAEVQGLLGSTKADTDRVNADWQARYSKLEADAAAARDESGKVTADWQGRYSKLEADLAGVRDAAATSDAARADWESRHNKINADWTARFATIESELTASRNRAASLDTSIADWQGRYRTLETDHANCGTRILGLSTQLAEATSGPDDLLLIEGIGPKINQALIASGVTKWKQVRDADEATLRAAIEKAGITFAPSITTWSGQAKYLCDGDKVGFTAYTEFLTSGQDASKGGQSVEDYITQARPRIAAAMAAGKDDLHTKDGKDNLQIVEGIGPKFNQACLDAGIDTFVKLSQASEDDLRAALTSAGLSFAPSLPTWAKQAELLAKGDRAAFDEYVSFLVAGRDGSKPKN
jgi:predicted flap endonuclease-1-like 5' DNA nuclease